jgi:hypothetical protein
MIRLMDLLKEAKQVGSLYHYTSEKELKGILDSNELNVSTERYQGHELYFVSFTRNKNFHRKGANWGIKTDYRITIDGDKLSNKYKIQPFAYKPGWDYADNWEYDWLEDESEADRRHFFDVTGQYDEQEERIYFRNHNSSIEDIDKYILAVDKVEDITPNNLTKSQLKQIIKEEISNVVKQTIRENNEPRI